MTRSLHMNPARLAEAREPDALNDAQRTALETFQVFLASYRSARKRSPLGAGTRQLYVRTVTQAMKETGSVEPTILAKWATAKVTERTPRGTADAILPAMRRYAESTGVPLESSALPYVGHLAKGFRDGLDEDGIDVYVRCVEASAIPNPARAILLLLPEMGLRIAEICALTGADLEVRSERLGVVTMGKGQKLRWVPLSKHARAILNSYRPSLKLRANDGPRPTIGPLFPGSLVGRAMQTPIKPSTVRRYLSKARATWPPELRECSPHSLRHAFCTRALRAGMHMRTLQAIIGHAPGSRTTFRYLHPSSSDLANAMDAMGQRKIVDTNHDDEEEP